MSATANILDNNALSKTTLILGDCLDKIKSINDNSIDLTVTSPPYDSLRGYEAFSFENFCVLAKELFRVTKVGGTVVWVVGDATIKGSESGNSFKQALQFKEVGFNLHDTMIYWRGFSKFPDSVRYGQSFEYMFILTKGKPKTFNPIKVPTLNYTGKPKSITDRNADNSTTKKTVTLSPVKTKCNVWEIDSGYMRSTKYKEAYQHPAIFPEQLALDHIQSWSNPGDIVFDPFLGSGTTGVASKMLGREFIGIELSPEYFEIAKKRIGSNE